MVAREMTEGVGSGLWPKHEPSRYLYHVAVYAIGFRR